MEQIRPTGRIIRADELATMVPYGPQQIRRLERANQFPRRVRVGANRVGWVLCEVELWLATRIGER